MVKGKKLSLVWRNTNMVNKNTLGAKKWRGQEKQQRLKGVILECGQGFTIAIHAWMKY